MHSGRVLSGQKFLPPGLENFRRASAAPRRNVERPAEMFTCVTKTDAQAVMLEQVVIKGAYKGELLEQRRWGFNSSAVKASSDLTRHPGLALRTASDHD